jgi:hypothetical protein
MGICKEMKICKVFPAFLTKETEKKYPDAGKLSRIDKGKVQVYNKDKSFAANRICTSCEKNFHSRKKRNRSFYLRHLLQST